MPVHEPLREGFAAVAPGVAVHYLQPNHSGLLSRDILGGTAADVFISAGWRYVLELHEAGLLPQPEVIAGNRLALLVRPERAAEIQGITDLARPGVRVLVPPEEFDPLAQYTRELFTRAGLNEAIAAKRERGEISEQLGNLRETLAAAGVDALVMYSSMLERFRDAGTAVDLPTPFDLNDRIVFGGGVVVRNGQTHPAATRFVEYLIGPPGQAVLTKAGLLPREHAARALS